MSRPLGRIHEHGAREAARTGREENVSAGAAGPLTLSPMRGGPHRSHRPGIGPTDGERGPLPAPGGAIWKGGGAFGRPSPSLSAPGDPPGDDGEFTGHGHTVPGETPLTRPR